MKRHNENRAKGIALGVMAATALTAAGAYYAMENQRTVKKAAHKMAKKAGETAERTLEGIEVFLHNNM